MIHLYSSNIVVGIWFGMYMGSWAFGWLLVGEFVGGGDLFHLGYL